MNLATYARRNMFRRKGRTILTVIVVAVSVLVFCALRTFENAFTVAAQDAMQDRLATRHKSSMTLQLPKRYIDEIRGVQGVRAATWANWFGAKDPKERIPFFAGFAADHETWFDVYDDMKVDPAQLQKWKETPNGVIIGDLLATTFNVKPGDKLTITSDIYPGDWDFEVVGIYYPNRRTVDRNSLVLRWDYLNNDPRAAFAKDTIGWISSRTAPGARSAEVSQAIDAVFEERDDQTVTMSEEAFNLSFMGSFGALIRAFVLVGAIILLIMLLVLANTVAMNVRERTNEYGVLRALGFSPGSVRAFILGESTLVALAGGLLGVALVVLLINMLLGPLIENNPAAMLPYFRTPTSAMLIALGATTALGVVAAVFPARRAAKLRVTDALRRAD